jgi:hypothetical protein
VSVSHLGFVRRVSLSIRDPVPPAVFGVPVVIQDEPCTQICELPAAAVAVAGTVSARHGVEHPYLREKRLFGLPCWVAVAIEKGEESPVLGIRRAFDPERKEGFRQVRLGVIPYVFDFSSRWHGLLLVICVWDNAKWESNLANSATNGNS